MASAGLIKSMSIIISSLQVSLVRGGNEYATNNRLLAWSGFMDITLALLPWHILWGLSIDRKEKLSALAAMSMGILWVKSCIVLNMAVY